MLKVSVLAIYLSNLVMFLRIYYVFIYLLYSYYVCTFYVSVYNFGGRYFCNGNFKTSSLQLRPTHIFFFLHLCLRCFDSAKPTLTPIYGHISDRFLISSAYVAIEISKYCDCRNWKLKIFAPPHLTSIRLWQLVGIVSSRADFWFSSQCCLCVMVAEDHNFMWKRLWTCPQQLVT